MAQQLSRASQDLLRSINYPGTLPPTLRPHKIIETHISLVILGESEVLKLKKPVTFGFVDHSELTTRWNACVNEIILNRRLTDDIYQGLVVFTKESIDTNQPYRILHQFLENAPPSGLIEAGVLMRRIPDEAMLDALIHNDAASVDKHIKPLGRKLADFHQSCIQQSEKELESIDVGSVLLEDAINDNARELEKHAVPTLGTSSRFALQFSLDYLRGFIEENGEKLCERIAKNFIVDGHGDLRAEHVCFEGDRISIIDCIEFNESLRRVDVLNDLAFLRMDFERLERDDLAQALITEYREGLSEPFDDSLLNYFSVYRALVRAKVDALTSAQQQRGLGECAEYIALACRYAAGLNSPFLLLVGGLMGVGKSSLAHYMTNCSLAKLFSSDAVRREIQGRNEEDRKASFGSGKYTVEMRSRVYDELLSRTDNALTTRCPTIVDASFAEQRWRDMFVRLAKERNVPVYFVHCQLEPEQHTERLRARDQETDRLSDGRLELLAAQRAEWEAPSSTAGLNVVEVDTAEPLQEQVGNLLVALS